MQYERGCVHASERSSCHVESIGRSVGRVDVSTLCLAESCLVSEREAPFARNIKRVNAGGSGGAASLSSFDNRHSNRLESGSGRQREKDSKKLQRVWARFSSVTAPAVRFNRALSVWA